MNMLVKALIGTAVVATTGAIVAVVADKNIKKEAQEKVDNATNDIARAKAVMDRNELEQKNIIGRIKAYVQKKVIKFLGWVALHMEQIEAASVVIGLVSGCISIAGAIKDYRKGSDLEMKIDNLQETINKTNKAQNHNNYVFGVALDYICDKVEVDPDELKKDLERIA